MGAGRSSPAFGLRLTRDWDTTARATTLAQITLEGAGDRLRGSARVSRRGGELSASTCGHCIKGVGTSLLVMFAPRMLALARFNWNGGNGPGVGPGREGGLQGLHKKRFSECHACRSPYLPDPPLCYEATSASSTDIIFKGARAMERYVVRSLAS